MADLCNSAIGPQDATYWASDAMAHPAPEGCADGHSAATLPVIRAQAQVEGLLRAAIDICGAGTLRYLQWLDDEGWQHVLQPC